MITRSELGRIAELKHLSLRNAERDYLIELVLFSTVDFRRWLVLKGGTALYKFHNLNRFSEDIDFDMVGRRSCLEPLVRRVLRNLERLGMPCAAWEKDEHQNEVNVRFVVRGPLYDGTRGSLSTITINFSKRERPASVQDMFLTASYPEIPSFELSVLGIEEIAAEKIRGVMTRKKPRDVYDLWFLVKRKNTKVDVSLVNKKLRVYGLEFQPERFRERLEQNRGMWVRDLRDLIMGPLPDFDTVVAELTSECEKWV
ncbi:MAG: nucleotidyl transferase AbiEii/AbiGii toxin family protein [Candidatus Hadarchaeales archaeon]